MRTFFVRRGVVQGFQRAAGIKQVYLPGLASTSGMAALQRAQHSRSSKVLRHLVGWLLAVSALSALQRSCFTLPWPNLLRSGPVERLAGRCRHLVSPASEHELPFDEDLYADLARLAKVWGRRLAFHEFAQSLRPDWPVNDVVDVVARNAQKLLPDCTIQVVGSCDRDVHNI